MPVMAGISIARATMALCDVCPPIAVTMPTTSLRAKVAVSAGDNSCATTTDPAGGTIASSSSPRRTPVTRSARKVMSLLRSRKYSLSACRRVSRISPVTRARAHSAPISSSRTNCSTCPPRSGSRNISCWALMICRCSPCGSRFLITSSCSVVTLRAARNRRTSSSAWTFSIWTLRTCRCCRSTTKAGPIATPGLTAIPRRSCVPSAGRFTSLRIRRRSASTTHRRHPFPACLPCAE